MNKKIILALLLIAGISLFATVPTHAISDEQREAISQNCPSIRSSISRLQKADSRTRVFLGTSYEHILTNFISPLNVRLAKNNHPDTTLSEIQTQFSTKRTKFSETFTDYMKSMDKLTHTDCEKDTDNFYKTLETTRNQRQALNQYAKDLRTLTIKHIETVNKLKESL